MKVLVTGTTGYIGSAIAENLTAQGHTVVGIARSEGAATTLRAKGYEVVHGDITSPESIATAARTADAVIHTASTNDMNAPAADRAVVTALLDALEGSNKRFIYTSGVWGYGNTGEQPVDEDTTGTAPMIVAWREEIEHIVRRSTSRQIHPIIIRPAMVYGRGGGMVAMFAGQLAQGGSVAYPGTGENHWPLIHVGDLANLYVRALDKAAAGSVYNGVTEESMRVKDIAAAIANSRGVAAEAWPIEEARSAMGPMADALTMDQHVSGARARQQLG